MSIIPNSLNITLNTSIPGNRVISYKPYMTISDVKESIVLFNPLIKLNTNLMNKIPNNKLQLEFFNKGLFHSLNNLNITTKVDSLEKATKDGYIDNNIQVTLNVLFPINSIITINKESYIIMDVQWTKGDWKISSNSIPLPKLNDKNINSANIYNNVNNEIKQREDKLQKIPDDIKYGVNVTKVEEKTPVNKESQEKKEEKKSFIDNVKKVESISKNTNTNTSLIVNIDTNSIHNETNTNSLHTNNMEPSVNKKETITSSDVYKKRLDYDLYKKNDDNLNKNTIHVNPFSDTDTNSKKNTIHVNPFSDTNSHSNVKNTNTNTNTIGGNNVYNFNTYNYNGPKSSLSLKDTKKESENNISYNIAIDLQLYKGKTIPIKDIEKIKCMNKWNAIRKSFCNFTGQKYVIPPIYDKKGGSKRKLRQKTRKTKKMNIQKRK